MSLEEIYARHHVNRQRVLRRLAAGLKPQADINAWDLAVDPDGEVTDQNHFGGVQAVLELGIAAGVRTNTLVVDAGCGIGGSARVLAQAFGCSVLGIDQDERRVRDAIALTEICRLQDRVQFRRGDVLQTVPHCGADAILWGQAAWIHFPSPDTFLSRWIPTLPSGARIAMEDSFLLAGAANSHDHLLQRLGDRWAAHLVPSRVWKDALAANCAEVVHDHDITMEAQTSLAKLRRATAPDDEDVTGEERESWEMASLAFDRGLIEARRIVAIVRRRDE